MATLGSRISELRKLKGLKQREIADALGVKPPTVSSWERDLDKPGRDRLIALSGLLGASAESLLGEPSVNHDSIDTKPKDEFMVYETEVALASIAEPHFREMPQNVPVLGTGSCGGEGDFILNGEISEYVRRPLGVTTAPQVFAIWITGTSMYPRFSEGELAYVHPGRRPRPGDDVLIELVPTTDGTRPAFIKRLIKQTTDELIVQQFNPERVLTFAAGTVAAIFRILTINELMGT